MTIKAGNWVVYLRTLGKNLDDIKGVCEKTEWNAMELARPGLHHLVQEGIPTETEAERLARGASGDVKPTPWKKR